MLLLELLMNIHSEITVLNIYTVNVITICSCYVYRSGYNRWRWSETPSQILQNLCSKHGLPLPVLVGRRLQVGDQTFADSTTLSKGILIFLLLSQSIRSTYKTGVLSENQTMFFCDTHVLMVDKLLVRCFNWSNCR